MPVNMYFICRVRRFKYSRTCLNRPLKKETKIGFQDRILLNAVQKCCRMLQGEHSAILSTFIKLPFVIKIKAVVAGPAGRRAPDHFLDRVCFPPCPFFLFRLILLFTLILFNLPKFIDAIITNTRCACHQ